MESDDSNGDGDPSNAPDYYLSIGDREVQTRFCSLDVPANVEQLMGTVRKTTTGNFVVDFSDDAAWAAFDLSTGSIAALFDAARPESLSTRWLHLWYPYRQLSVMELLAKRYDFSPRLLALMCSDPRIPREYRQSTTKPPKLNRTRSWYRRSKSPIEAEEGEVDDEISEHASNWSTDSVEHGNLYRYVTPTKERGDEGFLRFLFRIADNVWHYSSVDFGRQYVCIGFNSLYGTKHPSRNVETTRAPLPHCTRVWTWLLLCEDNTVISIVEDPFPFANGTYTGMQLRILAETRRNLVNVFRSLSSIHGQPLLANNPMTLLPIRTRLGATPEETAHRESDAPGLLFYCLFENWHNSYTLVTRRESRYGVELVRLRREMFTRPTLEHIDRLDGIGQELGVLRRHYESYARIINRLLEPQTASPASLQNSHVVESQISSSIDTIRPPLVTERESLMGVSFSSAARMRFKRLRDLLDLYALSEVEEYIKQKEALVAMNFSLIAIKQSLDVDRLTRITLFLTKATTLFLPVSLATSYFTVELQGIAAYTARTYWICFAVILALSGLALVLFGLINGNLQTGEVVRSWWEVVQKVLGIAVGSSLMRRRTKMVNGGGEEKEEEEG